MESFSVGIGLPNEFGGLRRAYAREIVFVINLATDDSRIIASGPYV
jgi:hypothetical protein